MRGAPFSASNVGQLEFVVVGLKAATKHFYGAGEIAPDSGPDPLWVAAFRPFDQFGDQEALCWSASDGA